MYAHKSEASPPEPVSLFVPVALTKPALAAALGIDGGAIFQIFAVEDLGLSPAAIGTAFGLGLMSLPMQLWAGRMPLRLARRNLQIFLVLAAIQGALLAWLLAVGATGGLAATALVVTVTAEVAISVLFATRGNPCSPPVPEAVTGNGSTLDGPPWVEACWPVCWSSFPRPTSPVGPCCSSGFPSSPSAWPQTWDASPSRMSTPRRPPPRTPTRGLSA